MNYNDIDVNLINNMIKGIFLLILAVSGNFVAETLGCKTQKILSENMMLKHMIIILILYFTIGFTTETESVHPTKTMLNALKIYVLFLLFTKMDMTFTLIVFIFISIAYINYTYIDYYKKLNKKDNNEVIKTHEKIQKILTVTTLATLLLGFVLYFRKQYNDYYKTWSTISFIFGINKCKSLL